MLGTSLEHFISLHAYMFVCLYVYMFTCVHDADPTAVIDYTKPWEK